MLALTRKVGEKIYIMAPDFSVITIAIAGVYGGRNVRVAIEAPDNWPVERDGSGGLFGAQLVQFMREKLQGLFKPKKRHVANLSETAIFVALPNGWYSKVENDRYVARHEVLNAVVHAALNEGELLIARAWEATYRMRRAQQLGAATT